MATTIQAEIVGTTIQAEIIDATPVEASIIGIDLNKPYTDARAYSTFALAISGIGSTETTLLISDQQDVTADTTIQSTTQLMFLRGGSLNISNTKTVTINGHVDAGLYQIFEGAGDVAFGAGAVMKVYPEWWGENTTPGTTDMAEEIQAAIDAFSSGGIVSLCANDWGIGATLDMISNVILEGQEMSSVCTVHSTTIKLLDNANCDMVEFGTTCKNAGLRNIYLDGNRDNNAGTLYGVKFVDMGTVTCMSNFLDQVMIFYVNGYGIYGGIGHLEGYLRDVKVLYCDEDGIRLNQTYDWRFERVQSGWNEKNGLALISSSAAVCGTHRIYDPDFHHNGQGGGAENTLNGIYIFGKTSDIQTYGGMVNANQGNGMYLVGDATHGVPTKSCFVGTTFNMNSQKTTNTYSQVKLYSAANGAGTFLRFIGVQFFSNESGTLPKYGLEDAANDSAYSIGNSLVGCIFGLSSRYGSSLVYSDTVPQHWHIDLATVTESNVLLGTHGSATWDPGSINNGAEEMKAVTVTGAALGDWAIASFSLDVTDLVLNAQVTASNVVTCVLANNTGGAIDLAEGTVYVKVIKR